MWLWALIIVSGICAVSSFYLTYLAFRVNDQGAFLFTFFGIFFGGLFVTSLIKVSARKNTVLEPKPVSFVPHRFIMLALIVAAIGILAAIFLPLLLR